MSWSPRCEAILAYPGDVLTRPEHLSASRLNAQDVRDILWLVTFNERHLAAAARRFGVQVAAPGRAWKEISTTNAKK